MASNYKDILSHLSTEIGQETLLLYLQGKLSEEQKHEVEKKLLDDEFNESAMEGLQEFRDKEQLKYMVDMLNRDLKQRTKKKKQMREKLRYKDQPWLFISVLIILLLIVLSYFVIRQMLGK
jgi:hypothetical protein